MSILIFLLVLIILILVHELGHFAVAKFFGIRVDEFGLGFPPKLFGKRYGETEYTVNALPIGGFVRIYGEDPTVEHIEGPDRARSFVGKPRLIQAAVLVAGVAMNVLLAWVLFTAGFLFGMPSTLSPEEAQQDPNARLLVTSVLPGSPAEAVLHASDEIVRVESAGGVIEATDHTLLPSEVAENIGASEGATLYVTVRRHGEEEIVSLTPRQGIIPDDPERYATGFSMAIAGTITLPLHKALYEGGAMTLGMLRDVALGLVTLVSGAVTGTADLSQVSGPVGIVGLVGDAAALGFAYLITFTAFISLNLAVINLLPFPALDGGRLLFVMIEAVTRRSIKPVVANTLNRVGFIALLLLMVVVTWHDVARLL